MTQEKVKKRHFRLQVGHESAEAKKLDSIVRQLKEGPEGVKASPSDVLSFALLRLDEKALKELKKDLMDPETKWKLALEKSYREHLKEGGEEMDLYDFALSKPKSVAKAGARLVQ